MSCDTIIEPPEIHTPSVNGYGRISVTLTAGEAAAPFMAAPSMARTVFPSTVFAKYGYTFTKAGETNGVPQTPDDEGFFTLEVGNYTVEVKAFINISDVVPVVSGESPSEFSVGPGENDPVVVLLSEIDTGEGYFSYTITYPAGATAVITLKKLPDLEAPETLNPTALDEGNGITETLELGAGFYLLTILVTKDDLYAGISEVVYIYPPLTTVYTKDYVDADLVNAELTVTFAANGGSGEPPPQETGSPGDDITLPDGDGLTRTGYTFGGWNTNAGGTGINYNAGSSYTVAGNSTLYAKWNPITYTVTYDKNNDNAAGTTTDSSHTYDVDQNLTANGFTYTGYAFIGWAQTETGAVEFTNSQSVNNLTFTAGATVTLYAQWVPGYTVTFDKNGGDTEANPLTITVVPSTSTGTLPEPPTRTGYTFTGWNTQEDGTGTEFTATTTVTGDITVYGQWFPDYIVTFNKNGGDTEANPLTITVVPNTSTGTLPEPPTRTGYTFTGWNTQADGTGTEFTATTTVTGDITVYGQWERIVEMVYVPDGSFEMGTASGGESNERPVHTVTVSGFYMGRTEVTQAQYQTVMGTNPSSGYGVGDNYPVYYVSWYDALVFCNKLSMMEGLTPAYSINDSTDPTAWGSVPTSSNSTWNAVTIVSGSTGYRLPTEAQWEYVAKGGDGSPGNYTYAGSNTVGDVAWYWDNIPSQSSGNSGYGTQPVGTKAPNGLGIYDMSGNVYEWCWDWYGDYSSNAQADPSGASSGSYRVWRGGNWYNSAVSVRSAYRYYYSPTARGNYVGIRLVRP